MSLCRTCFDICQTDYSSPIEGEVKNMLQFCIPELDLNITENPVLCKSCQTTLIGLNEFKKKCLSTQQKILIFTNQSVKLSPVPVEPTPVLPKVIEKVAPFKLKLKNKLSDISRPEYKTINENENVEVHKRRYSEIAVAPTVKNEIVKSPPSPVISEAEDDQEDFLSLLENSNNVSNPKVKKLESLSKNDCTDFAKNTSSIAKGVECKLCKKWYKNKRYLNMHKAQSSKHKAIVAKSTAIQTGGHLYRCDKCSFSTKYKIGLNKHYLNCPKIETNDASANSDETKKAGSDSVCRVCSYVASTNAVLAAHMSKQHNAAWTMHKCNRCNFCATTDSKLREHKTDVHSHELKKKSGKVNATQKTPKEKIFICIHNGCGKGFVSKQGWILHQNKHALCLKKECNICKKQFENGRGFKSHMESHIKYAGVKTKAKKGSSSKESKKSAKKSVQKTQKNKPSKKKIGTTLGTNGAIEESESTGQILIRMDRVFSNVRIDNRFESNPVSDENRPISAPIEKGNMEDMDQLSEGSSSQSERNENEKPMFEVEFVGTISDNEDDSQDKNQIESETAIQQEEIEGEDQESSLLSQETIILSQDQQM